MTWPDYNLTNDAQAQSAFQSAAAANAITAIGSGSLSAIGQLQLAVANLLLGDSPVADTPAADVSPGTFAASTSDPTGAFTFVGNVVSAAGKIAYGASPGTTGAINVDASAYSGYAARFVGTSRDLRIFVNEGTYGTGIGNFTANRLTFAVNSLVKWGMDSAAAGTAIFSSLEAIAQFVGGATSTTFYQSNGSTIALQYLAAGAVGIGGSAGSNSGLYLTAAPTAAGAVAQGMRMDFAFTAAANNDVLRAFRIVPSAGTPGAFTGLQWIGIDVGAATVAGYTTPANPIGINVGVITGTGASVATALQLAPPTGASTNYLLSHTTPATFNVTAAGAITAGSTISAAGNSLFLSGTAVPATAGAVAAGAAIRMNSNLIAIEATTDAPTHIRPKGSLCININGSSGTTRLYVNTDGNTTWTNVVTAA